MYKHMILKSILSVGIFSAASAAPVQQDLAQAVSPGARTAVDSMALAKAQAKFLHAVQESRVAAPRSVAAMPRT